MICLIFSVMNKRARGARIKIVRQLSDENAGTQKILTDRKFFLKIHDVSHQT